MIYAMDKYLLMRSVIACKCPLGYYMDDSNICYKQYTDDKKWSDAKDLCLNYNSTLAIFKNTNEYITFAEVA